MLEPFNFLQFLSFCCYAATLVCYVEKKGVATPVRRWLRFEYIFNRSLFLFLYAVTGGMYWYQSKALAMSYNLMHFFFRSIKQDSRKKNSRKNARINGNDKAFKS